MTRTIREHDNGANASTRTSDIPSTAMSTRFLRLCDAYGAQRLAVHIVSAGRAAGVPGLPATDDWAEWSAKEMRAAVKYLEHKRGLH